MSGRLAHGLWSAVTLLLLTAAGCAVASGLARGLVDRASLALLLGEKLPVWLGLLALAAIFVVVAGIREIGTWRSGAPGRGAASIRAALTCCVGGAALFLALFPSFEKVWLDLFAGLVGGAFALSLLARRPGPSRTRGTARAIDFTLFSACLVLVLLELGLRGLGRLHPSPLLAQTDVGPWQYLISQRLAPGELVWGFPANSEGHYDDEFTPPAPGETVVATIGDSFSVGAVHHALHFTTVCEQATGVRVDNYGIRGVGPPEYLDMLRLWVAPRRPQLVIVDLFVGNDLILERVEGNRSWPALRSWLGRDNVLVYQLPRRLWRLREARAVSYAASPGRERASDLEHALALFPWMDDPRLEPPTYRRDNFLSIEMARVRGTGHTGDYKALYSMVRELRSAAGKIPFAVMLLPDEFQVEDDLWAEATARPDLVGIERDRAQRLLGAFLAREGIPCLDLLPVLRAVPPMADGRRHVYHLNDTHFNARGNRAVGLALAEFVRTQLGR
jgi:hypothetical protein